jgi:hypothetical protein
MTTSFEILLRVVHEIFGYTQYWHYVSSLSWAKAEDAVHFFFFFLLRWKVLDFQFSK